MKTGSKKQPKKAPVVEGNADERLAAKMEAMSEMLEIARRIVAELECGETVEKESDADHAIEEARDACRELLAYKVETASEDE